MAAIIPAPNTELPWSSSTDDDFRYLSILTILAIPFLILCVAIPYIDVPEPDRESLEKLPPQLARVVIEKKEIPKPKPPQPKKEKPKEEKKPEEKKKPEPKKEEPKPKEKKPEPEPIKIKKAREQAQSIVNTFADDLLDMRDALDVSDVKPTSATLTRSSGEAAKVERSVITSGAKTRSGGVNTAALSRDTGGTALGGRQTTVVESKLEDVSAAAEQQRQAAARGKAYRSDQDIRRQMDAAKGRIFSVYNRALRANPTLQGKVVFKMVIEPNGAVSKAEIVSSELDDPALERKLLAAIRFINFGAADVLQTTLNYSFDFLPY